MTLSKKGMSLPGEWAVGESPRAPAVHLCLHPACCAVASAIQPIPRLIHLPP